MSRAMFFLILAPWLHASEPMFLAHDPSPPDGAVGVQAALLTWTPGATAMWHNVYFGTDPDPPQVSFRQLLAMYYQLRDLAPGTTYYWRVDEIELDGTTIHKGPVWTFTSEPGRNFAPVPADGATSQLPGLTLTWTSGQGAAQYQVFFSTDATAVTAGSAAVDKGKAGEMKFNTGALRASTTYYWRVDVVKTDGTAAAGEVWNFTTANAGPANTILWEWWANISGTAVSILTSNPAYPGSPTSRQYLDLFRSAVDWADNYGQRLWGWLKPPQTGDYTFWIAGGDEQQLWLSTDGNPANGRMIAGVSGGTPAFDWDNTQGGTGGARQKSAAIKLEAGKKYFIMALGKAGTGGDSTAVAWQGPGIAAREVIQGQYVDMFYLAPLQAFGPTPANGAVDAAQSRPLRWGAGEKAKRHEIYFGDDKAAVATADTASPLFQGNQTGTTFDPGPLAWGKTYYWRVDEVNPAEADSPWKGTVWSFTTANFIPIDNMESYTDEEGSRIYEFWIDGWTNQTGSVVGNLVAPFVEQAIVHAGKQAMPLDYNNLYRPFYSEAELPLIPSQNWTTNGVTDLSLWFRGRPASFLETAGRVILSAAGAGIQNQTDQFRYAYQRLNGDGSITVRVDRLDNTHAWAKAGVMIRASLEPNAKAVHTMVSASNGIEFQYRPIMNVDTTQFHTMDSAAPLPRWVRLSRKGQIFTGEYSNDGRTWSRITTPIATSEQYVLMLSEVYLGMAVTSPVAGTMATAEFSNIQTTASGPWQVADIGVVHGGNSPTGLYVVVEDSAGKTALATHADPAATTLGAWTEWKIPLSSLTGVDLARVKKLSIGVSDKKAPVPGGSGRIYIDDIRVTKP